MVSRARLLLSARRTAAAIAILLLSTACAQVEAAGLPNLAVQALAVDPTNSQIVYAGTTNGVYKTLDGGQNWNRIDSLLTYTNVLALAIHPSNPCTIYAGIDSGLFNIRLSPTQVLDTTASRHSPGPAPSSSPGCRRSRTATSP